MVTFDPPVSLISSWPRGRGLSQGCRRWRSIGRQSLSEPTADEPFLFLLGALGFESSSS